MDKVGRYSIDALIGEGAMACVYRARDPEIGRTVAIKLLKPELCRDPGLTERFLRESRAAGMLSHPAIATIYDVGEADGIPYIAMEHIDGRPLDRAIEESGRMPHERVIEIGIALADALAYAHGQGVVHRDIKPSNIMLCDGGRKPKLLDFGIARVRDEEPGEAAARSVRTQVGQVIGTPRYMSPEQALGLPTDHRSDLFSLGVVLYEMLTGKAAFSGTGLATVAIQVAQQDPEPVERIVRDCPRGLGFILKKLLAKKPEQRFADAAQLRAALQRELESAVTGESARGRSFGFHLKLPLVLGAATALALFACVHNVLDRQRQMLEDMAITSGSSVTAFVATNAALHAAENAGLPPEQQDWMPLQAFVDAAAEDKSIARLVVVDDRGTIRAASDKRLVGTRYRPATGEALLPSTGGARVTESEQGGNLDFRFVRPIRYSGADFGKVDMLLRRNALEAALADARTNLIGLSIAVLAVVMLIAGLGALAILRPLRRLRSALDEVAKGNVAFRLSHRSRGETARLFDAFNRMTAAIEPRLAGEPAENEKALLQTRIVAPESRRRAA